MACDTFIKIANKCRRHFVTVQIGEAQPFIDEILANMMTCVNQLEPQQVSSHLVFLSIRLLFHFSNQIHTFCEAVGYIISAQTNEKIQEQLIKNFMEPPNMVWNEILKKASEDSLILTDQVTVKQLDFIIKTNYHACKSLGHNYILQLKTIFFDMLCLYKAMSDKITQAIAQNGEVVTKQPIVRSMLGVKKEILKLINEWVLHSNDNKIVLQSILPPLLEAVLADYKLCAVPSAREPEVLSTMSTIVKKLEVNGLSSSKHHLSLYFF